MPWIMGPARGMLLEVFPCMQTLHNAMGRLALGPGLGNQLLGSI